MRITAELSLYPLHDGYLDMIETAIRRLREIPSIDIVVNQLSTQIRGEVPDVMGAIETLVTNSFSSGTPQVLVTKIVNADLPIDEAPEV